VEGSLTRHRARVVWEGSKRDLRAHRLEVGGVELAGSCSPEWGGDPGRADPEGLFVAALSACHMLWFLALTRERRIRVLSYADEAVGELDHERQAFRAVELRPRVGFTGEPAPELLSELHEEAHRRCYIANSASCPVRVAAEVAR
jgi:organic hydroperoxide reductase OsmC/OhrA